jgi:hypothetical protein
VLPEDFAVGASKTEAQSVDGFVRQTEHAELQIFLEEQKSKFIEDCLFSGEAVTAELNKLMYEKYHYLCRRFFGLKSYQIRAMQHRVEAGRFFTSPSLGR